MEYPEYKIAHELMERLEGITFREALKLAIGIQRNLLAKEANEFFKIAYGLTPFHKDPTVLEAIAMQLGYSDSTNRTENVVDAIHSVMKLLEERIPKNA